MAKVKPTKKQSQEIADKLTAIFLLIETSLTEKDFEYLRAMEQQVKEEMGTLQAVAGLLVPLEKAEAKQKLASQALRRIKGLAMIYSAIAVTPEINKEYHEKKAQQKNIESMFGL